jgi:excisionase family DNA binding protein
VTAQLELAVPAFRLHSIKEVAEATGVHADTIRRAIHEGELVAHKLRGQFRIRDCDLEAWLRRCRHHADEDVLEAVPLELPSQKDYRWNL